MPAPTDGIRLTTAEFGRIEVDTVPIPDGALDTYATYTPSGKIFLLFRRDDDPADQEIFHAAVIDRKSTRLNSSHVAISYAVFCLKKKKIQVTTYLTGQ